MKVLLLLLLTVSLTYSQYFIPTQYDTVTPQPYRALDSVDYQATLCSISQYVGCVVNITANLPHDPWDYIDGRYLEFSVVSDVDGCTKELCRNNPSSVGVTQSSCSFDFTNELANIHHLFIKTQSGASPDNVATVNLMFMCKNRKDFHPAIQSKKKKRDMNQNLCPSTAKLLKEVIQLDYQSQVITSPSYVDASKFFFFLCGDGVHRYRATALTIGTTIDSAFATYVCQASPCTPTSSTSFDASGTGLNTVFFQTSTPNPVEFYVTIYGWGKYRQPNYFRFGVNIEDVN